MPGIFRSIAAAAPAFDVEITDNQVRDIGEMDGALTTLGQQPNTGVIVPPALFTTTHSALLVALAAKYRLPTIYAFRFTVAAGGLISYGVDGNDLWIKAAGYVYRILRGAKPADRMRVHGNVASTLNILADPLGPLHKGLRTHVGIDRAGMDRVDTDFPALTSKREGGRLGEQRHATLGHRVE